METETEMREKRTLQEFSRDKKKKNADETWQTCFLAADAAPPLCRAKQSGSRRWIDTFEGKSDTKA